MDLTGNPEVGTPIIIFGPMDFALGIYLGTADGWLILEKGCVTTRNITSLTAVIATGKPHGAEYVVHPRGHQYSLLAATGWSRLPSYDPKDWPARR